MQITCANCGYVCEVPKEILIGLESVDQIEPYICDACENQRDLKADDDDHEMQCCGGCGLPPRPRPEPIGKIRVTCVDCGTEYECDHDDVWGFDDADPIYMCGTCQRRRRFDYGA